ncbi:MAG: Lrp/AsnC family transcriptional regulator [Candidatus Bathyarchaeota archaeon]
MKLDSIDLFIIKSLLQDARTPLAKIARKLGEPTSKIHYRLNKMHKEGIIKGFTIYSNPSLGDEQTHALSVRAKVVSSQMEEVIDYLNNFALYNRSIKHTLIPYVWPCAGYYNLGIYVFTDTAIGMSSIIQLLKRHQGIIDVKVGVVLNEQWFFKSTFFEQLQKKVKNSG